MSRLVYHWEKPACRKFSLPLYSLLPFKLTKSQCLFSLSDRAKRGDTLEEVSVHQ